MGSDVNGRPALIPFKVSNTESYVIVIVPDGGAGLVNFIQIYRNDGSGTLATITFQSSNIISPFLGVDPKGYTYAQSGDILFLAHAAGTARPIMIVRTAEDTFEVGDYMTSTITGLITVKTSAGEAAIRQPYKDPNISAVTMSFSGTSGSITVTASEPFFSVKNQGYYKFTHGSITGLVLITTPATSLQTTASGNVVINLSTTAATTNWQQPAWSEDSYPKTVAIYESRLCWGGTESEPDRLWLSLTGNLFHMMQLRFAQDSSTDVTGSGYFGTNNQVSDPFAVIIGANDTNKITWMSSGDSLFIGTLGGEYIINKGQSNSFDPPTRSTNSGFDIKLQTSYGATATKVTALSNEVFYVTRDGKRIRSFRFSRENGSYVSSNMSFLSDHMHKHGEALSTDIFFTNAGKFAELAYQSSREIIWTTTTKNELLTLAYSKEEGVQAWARHTLGGNDVSIWGVAVVPNSSGTFDDIYVGVSRTVDSATVYYLEIIGGDWDLDALSDVSTSPDDIPFFTDSAVVRSLILGASTITGLSHLEGEIVSVVQDGDTFVGEFTVVAGEVTIPTTTEAVRMIVGLPYDSTVDLLRLETGHNFESTRGATQNIDEVALQLYKTANLEVTSINDEGNEAKHSENIRFNNEVFTGIKRAKISMTPGIDGKVRLKSNKPFPCAILAVTARGVTND